MIGEVLALVRRKLEAAEVEPAVQELILAACEGERALERRVSGEPAAEQPPELAATGLPPLWLGAIGVEGFRGVAGRVTLELAPKPGLVVITGRNGTGKSTFAEGLETLLKGTSRRWEDRPADFADGWRNVHHEGPVKVAATFVQERGEPPLHLEMRWEKAGGVNRGELRSAGEDPLPDELVGRLRAAAEMYSPMLAYGDLSRRLESQPKDLYATMTSALGLEDIEQAYRRLASLRARVAGQRQEAERERVRIVGELGRVSGDERARGASELLSAAERDHDALEALVGGEEVPSADVTGVRRLGDLRVPADLEVADIVAELRAAHLDLAALRQSSAERARRLATLLDAALAWHVPGEEAPCPVCAVGRLADDFRARASREATAARQVSVAVDLAEARAAEGEARALALVREVPVADLARAELLLGWEGSVSATVRGWVGVSSAGPGLADRLEAAWPAARLALDEVRRACSSWLSQREDQWRPLRLAIAGWLSKGRAMAGQAELVARLTAAERWLKAAESDLGNERFAPIAQHAAALWKQLGDRSHVALATVRLTGLDTRRKIEMLATVDGVDSRAAVGVMSQGELNALALALFVPRATMAESPFRFVVLDDPVQAMDPVKVDGLARVLGELAETRQVLVLTHDARLLEALRRLRVPTRLLEVCRAPRSRVTLRPLPPPEQQFLDEASQVIDSDLPEALRRITVPNLCRYALEAVLVDAAWRRCLELKLEHDAVAEQIQRCRGTRGLASLALFGHRQGGEEVEPWLARELDPELAEAYTACNSAGGHGTSARDLTLLVRSTRRLVERLTERLA